MTLLLLVLMAFISSSAIAANTTSINTDITIATQEMQKANYFTFVTLINMSPFDMIQNGITFLMPNDRTLSKTDMSESSVVDFLLRHSIPSPLLIDHLEHFPTGSMIPTSKPGSMFKVTNDGRRRFFLSNVRIISPNICTKTSSIRCHGIDEVVQPEIVPQPTCFNSTNPPMGAAAPPSQPSMSGGSTIAAPTPPSVVSPPKSSSPNIGHGQVVDLIMTLFMLGVVELLLLSSVY